MSNAQLCSRLSMAFASQADAEQLTEILAAAIAENPGNPYLADAHRKAVELVAEMDADVEDLMGQVEPEQFERWIERAS